MTADSFLEQGGHPSRHQANRRPSRSVPPRHPPHHPPPQAAEHRRRLEEQEAALKERHGRAMAAVVAENKEQTLRLKAEFDRVQGVMQHTVRGLEAKLQELEAQYENRESRQVCDGQGGISCLSGDLEGGRGVSTRGGQTLPQS